MWALLLQTNPRRFLEKYRSLAINMTEIAAGPPTFHQPSLLRLLSAIDRLPDGATGALVFTAKAAPQGTVLIEDNRVCWAAASNMENRLTDILRHQNDPVLPVDVFEELYEECYRDKIPLGETLVERGLVTTEGLWKGLRQHTAEAIAVLATAEMVAPVWASNQKRRYDAQYTFSTAELLCTIGSFGFEERGEDADYTLREVTPRNAVGVAYLGSHEHGLPIAQVSAESWDVSELVRLGEWALGALEPTEGGDGEGDGDVMDTVVESVDGSSLQRAWRCGPLVYVRWLSGSEHSQLEGSAQRVG